MKGLTLFLMLFCFGITQAQIVDIPNNDFKAKLLLADTTNEIAKDLSGNFFKIDANDDGEIQVSEAFQTSYLDVQTNITTNLPQNLIGIEAFINLEYLDCSQSSISSLSLNQNINLQYLNCSISGPQYIPVNLDVSQNINLETLITARLLTDLEVSHMPNLEELRFRNDNQSNLDVSNNLNLRILECYDGALTSLDVTSNVNLEELICSRNLLENLDLSQNINLTVMRCDYNLITEIDVSQNIAMVSFYGHGNNFTYLDFSNNENLTNLWVQVNDLNTLIIKNGSNESTIHLGVNPNLLYVCADTDELTYVNSLVEPTTIVSSYCTFVPGGNFNTITGTILFDTNNDGCNSSNLPALNVNIAIDDGTVQGSTFANNSGNYNFYIQEGNFVLTPSIENPTWFSISPESVIIPFADNDNNSFTQDFCVTAVGEHNDVEVLINPILHAQPGFDAKYQIVYRNKGNQTLSGDLSFEFDDTVLDYISASVIPDSQTTGNLSWNYIDLVPFETRSFEVTLNVNGPTETPAVNIDDILSFSATINPVAGDETPADNTFNFNQTVIGSFDPNDKTCLEGDSLEPEMIGEYLHYNINFENTGTAAATFVVVKDVIDESMFDMNTLQVMYASHEMVTNITGNTVEFIFDEINLGPEEKGNVVFKLKTLDSLEIDDVVTNNAEIYFDYNFPIVTNTTVTTFETLSIDEFNLEAISMYPNPAKDLIEITSKNTIETIEIYDVQGRLVMTKTINKSKTTVNISNFTKGIYFLNFKTELGKSVKKVIKN